MDLLDVIDPNFNLVEDNNTGRKFGDNKQLVILGWSGRNSANKRLILFCEVCSTDSEMFGEGYFASTISNLLNNKLPCGCAPSFQRTLEQSTILANRACEKLGLIFIRFKDDNPKSKTKCVIECPTHGIYETTSLNSLLNQLSGCRKCAQEAQAINLTKSDDWWAEKFLSTGRFHYETKFTRSDIRNNRGYCTLWNFSCPVCNWQGISHQSNLAAGKIPCECSYVTKMNEAYINLISDCELPVALKFGISCDSKNRLKNQDKYSSYTFTQIGIWKFKDHYYSRAAETFLKNTLVCGVLSKQELLDGHTETTYTYNLETIIRTYEKFGGLRID